MVSPLYKHNLPSPPPPLYRLNIYIYIGREREIRGSWFFLSTSTLFLFSMYKYLHERIDVILIAIFTSLKTT